MPGLLAISALVLALSFGMWGRLVESLIFQPTSGVDLLPSQLGVSAEEVFLQTEDGVRIHAFYLPAPGADRGLLFLHGNAGNASHRLPNAVELMQLGCNVLLLDYRGYGRSEGRPSEPGVYADARAGLAHLIDRRGLPQSRIVVFGRSLGGAVAVDLAVDRPLAGLILESTFTSIADLGRTLGGRWMGALAGERFDSAAKIARVQVPLLFFHGDRDEIVDERLGRRLFDAARPPKRFETIAGAGHNDTVQVGGRRYYQQIRAFLDEVTPAYR